MHELIYNLNHKILVSIILEISIELGQVKKLSYILD